MGSLFKRGYKASREEKKKQDENRKNSANRLYDFYLSANDGDDDEPPEAEINFLTEEPVNFFRHTIPDGQNKYKKYTCPGKNCPYCADGLKPSATGAYLIVDERPYKYTDKNGKKQKGDKRLRLFAMGMRVVSQLDRISSKRGLTGRDITIVRMGSGQSTTYTFEDGDEHEYDEDEIRELMPEKMKKEWDGSDDGLMDIIEDQLKMQLPDNFNSSRSRNDDDDDEDYGDDDNELTDGEEEKPKKPLHRSKDKSSKSSLSEKLGGKKKSTFKKKGKSKSEGFMDLGDDDDEYVKFK